MSVLRRRNYVAGPVKFTGLYGDGVNDYLSLSDSINMGTGDFSVRFWFGEIIPKDYIWLGGYYTAISDRQAYYLSSSGGVTYNHVFAVNDLTNEGSASLSPGSGFFDQDLRFFGHDKITHDMSQWIGILDDSVRNPFSVQKNQLASQPAQAIELKMHEFLRYFQGSVLGYAGGTILDYMIFAPALTQAQNNWIFNSRKGNDPTSIDAKYQGIGVEGVDFIGVGGITTLLKRWAKFNDLFTSGADEYVREEVSNNNLYAKLNGYAAGETKIKSYHL